MSTYGTFPFPPPRVSPVSHKEPKSTIPKPVVQRALQALKNIVLSVLYSCLLVLFTIYYAKKKYGRGWAITLLFNLGLSTGVYLFRAYQGLFGYGSAAAIIRPVFQPFGDVLTSCVYLVVGCCWLALHLAVGMTHLWEYLFGPRPSDEGLAVRGMIGIMSLLHAVRAVVSILYHYIWDRRANAASEIPSPVPGGVRRALSPHYRFRRKEVFRVLDPAHYFI